MLNLMQGDCLELMKNFEDGSVDFTLTDIPYDAVNRSSNGLRNLDKGNADILTFKDLLDMVDRMKEHQVPVDTPLYFMSKNQKEFALKNEAILTTIGERRRGIPVSEMKREEFKFPSDLEDDGNDKLCFRINIEKKDN